MVIVKCLRCGKDFKSPSRQGQIYKYCSMSCRTQTPEVRFWKYVEKTDGCWLWGASTSIQGYGYFKLNRGKIVLSHRFSYELHKGPIPPGLFVCHSCDNPTCVNPKHLWLGTSQDNMDDKVTKSRQSCLKGTDNPAAKLSEDKVREIRNLWANNNITQTQLGIDFNMAQAHISDIVNRKVWRHLD